MRFLIDNAFSPTVSVELKKLGHDFIHVRDIGLQDAEDIYTPFFPIPFSPCEFCHNITIGSDATRRNVTINIIQPIIIVLIIQ